jgi:hypothetical protein
VIRLAALALALGGCSLLVSVDGLSGGNRDGGGGDGPAPASDSPTSCMADFSTDRNNCGMCGHSCGGPECLMGKCQPRTVLSAQSLPLGLAISPLPRHATYLYWVNQDPPSLWRARKDGTGSEAMAAAGVAIHPFDIDVDEVSLYWSEAKDFQVYQKPLDGGGTKISWRQPGGEAGFIATDGVDLFAASFSPLPAAGHGDSIVTMQNLYSNLPIVGGLAARTGFLYWVQQGDRSVVRAPIVPGVPQVVAHAVGRPMGLAVDDTYLYWVEDSQQIMRAPLTSGTQPEAIFKADAPFGDSDVAVDNDFVFWSESKTGLIRRLAKPAP